MQMKRQLKNAWLAGLLAVAAVGTVVDAFGDGSDEWVYDESQRVPPVPATAESTLGGVDVVTFATGSDSLGVLWRALYAWDASAPADISFFPPGLFLLIK